MLDDLKFIDVVNYELCGLFQDETLCSAVATYRGKNWKKIGMLFSILDIRHVSIFIQKYPSGGASGIF